MEKITRIYPESRTGLINWIEENFSMIDEFVVIFHLKDETTMTVYDCYSYLSALGLTVMTTDTIQNLQRDGNFQPKPRA